MKKSDDKYRIQIPTLDYYDKLVACRSTCPVGTDSGGYAQAIARGDYEQAYLIARQPNPFASVCGRVCNAPCEAACRHNTIDEAVSIRALKRFVTEKYGPEVTTRNNIHAAHTDALGHLNGYNTGEKVAIIGSGAAGLSAAHDLARLGYKVTAFESLPVMGGCFYLVPEYRLPRDLVRAEIDMILQLGIEPVCNTIVGKDISFVEIQKDYDAIVIAIGAWVSRKIPIDGIDHKSVLSGINFLRQASFYEATDLGDKITVIGGGNVAMDVARVAIRVGVKEVNVVCLESLEDMPAEDIEKEEALEEGVNIYSSNGPQKVVTDSSGKLIGLGCQKVASVFDADGRFNPSFVENSEWVLECDQIILSVGQASDSAFLPSSHGFKISRFGTVVADPETMWTGVPGIYAAGDAAYGPSIFIKAIASGQLAARSIHEKLSGEKIKDIVEGKMIKIDDHIMPFGYEKLNRVNPSPMDVDTRIGGHDAVELGYTEQEAKDQANRCYNCHVNTIFDGTKCIACGGCVDVCPESCLKLVPLDEIDDSDDDLKKLIEAYYGISLDCLNDEEKINYFASRSAMIKNDDRCIRCGICSKRCPVDAISMERLEVSRSREIVQGGEKEDE